jgi:hypothetical protein
MKPSALDSFLAKNKDAISSADGLPGEFQRRGLFRQVRRGKKVGIVTPHGSRLCGWAVMVFPTHAVLNLGGRHGTTGIASPANCIFVAGGKL